MTVVILGEWGLTSAKLRGLSTAISLAPEDSQFCKNEEAQHNVLSNFCGSSMVPLVGRLQCFDGLSFQLEAGIL